MSTASPDAASLDADALLRAVRLVFVLLICGDLVYMAIHVGHLTIPALRGAHYSLETDGGLAEFYQYVKQMWVALCLAVAFVRRRQLVLLAWSGFFGFLMLDDALQFHEQAGLWLGERFALPAVAGLRPDDLGELIVGAAVGASLLLVLAVAWWRDRERTWRLSRALLILTGALGVCGVIVDAVHVVAYFRVPALANPLAFVEDGGELLIVTALTAYALDLAARGTAPPARLRHLLLGSRAPQASP